MTSAESWKEKLIDLVNRATVVAVGAAQFLAGGQYPSPPQTPPPQPRKATVTVELEFEDGTVQTIRQSAVLEPL